jgi:hypothetical protein
MCVRGARDLSTHDSPGTDSQASRCKSCVSDNGDLVSVTQAPTDYFTREEYARLLDATDLDRENTGESIGGTHGTRIRTLIMLTCCLEFWVDHGQTGT